MFLRRSAGVLSRRAVAPPVIRAGPSRAFSRSVPRRDAKEAPQEKQVELEGGTAMPGRMVPFEEVKTMDDLLPPGAEPGTFPTDENQSTGLERLEILGKMQGIDVFDMRPLDASRKGTLDNPIITYSMGDEQFAGCTGYPADSHWTIWILMDRKRPVERCKECGSVYKMEYIGPPDDAHHEEHHHHDYPAWQKVYYEGHPELLAEQEAPKWFDYVKPEYRWA